MNKSLEQNKVIDIILWAIAIVIFISSLFYELGKDSYFIHPDSFLW